MYGIAGIRQAAHAKQENSEVAGMSSSIAGLGLVMWLLGAIAQFLIIYFAVRLALKHDRERGRS